MSIRTTHLLHLPPRSPHGSGSEEASRFIQDGDKAFWLLGREGFRRRGRERFKAGGQVSGCQLPAACDEAEGGLTPACMSRGSLPSPTRPPARPGGCPSAPRLAQRGGASPSGARSRYFLNLVSAFATPSAVLPSPDVTVYSPAWLTTMSALFNSASISTASRVYRSVRTRT